MQKTTTGVVIPESLINGIGTEDDGERQVAAGDAFGQAEQIRPYSSLLMCKKAAGATKANGNFVADQMRLIGVAQRPHPLEILRVIHGHARGALDEGFQNNGGDAAVTRNQ